MLAALARFLEFLEDQEGIVCPWAWPILKDVEALTIRSDTAPRRRTSPDAAEWYAALMEDLAVRLLRPVYEEGAIDASWDPARERELLRDWLARRDAIIRGGEARPERVLEIMMAGPIIQ